MDSPGLADFPLNDGNRLPAVGFGTSGLRGEDGLNAFRSALEAGYRYVDTAVNYGNEAEVGKAVRSSDLDRADVLVATKVPGRDHAKDKAVRSVEDSLRTLGLDYLDVVLIHWPNPSQGLYVQAWEALVEVRERELVRSIGVSNFTTGHLDRIIDATGVTPALNQIEMHPYFTQEQMRTDHVGRGVLTQSWSPLGKGTVPFDAPAIAAAAERHDVSPGQVILRWHLHLGAQPLPKSGDPGRQAQNLDLAGFALTEEEVTAISALTRADGRRFGGDPNTHEEM
ncbi:aldo/keto reductase [Pseudactinotalea sp. Z1732]|uniref:aldo/keto reductase n=1 Tax=Micrococcales TaxID=85006 RepID=UPI003C7D82D6